MIAVIITLSAFLLPDKTFSQTTINAGNVSGVWDTTGSPYQVYGDLNVIDGQVLTINPGVEIVFFGYYRIRVYGLLKAMGNVNDSIHFTVNDTTGYADPASPNGGWNRIFMVNSGDAGDNNESSELRYCSIEYGKPTGTYNKGGAVFAQESKVIISNCEFKNNTAASGGGVYTYFSRTTITNTTVENNKGEGIFISNSDLSEITGNIVRNNTSEGIYLATCVNSVVKDNTIDSNATNGLFINGSDSITISGNEILANGSDGIHTGSTTLGITIINNNISENTVLGIDLNGDGTIINNTIVNNMTAGIEVSTASPYIFSNTITGNSSEGITVYNATPFIINNTLSYNLRGIRLSASDATITNNIICNNNNLYDGAGIDVNSSSPTISNNLICNNTTGTSGGGISLNESDALLYNNTIVNNSASWNGAGILVDSLSAPVFRNCIIYGNLGTYGYGDQVRIWKANSQPEFYFCDIEGGLIGFDAEGPDLSTYLFDYANASNIDTLPDFVLPAAGAGDSFDGLAADLSLNPGSPCINSGDTSFTTEAGEYDFSFSQRLVDTIDIGAYEYGSSSWPIVLEPIPDTITLGSPAGSSAQISLNANTEWMLALTDNWISANMLSGNDSSLITITSLQENDLFQTITSQVLFTNIVGDTAIVTVLQEGIVAELSVIEDTIWLASLAGSNDSIHILSNISWTALSDQSWLVLDMNNGSDSMAVVATAVSTNPTNQDRTAIVSITGADSSAVSVVIIQEGIVYEISVSPDTVILAQPASSYGGFIINSNMSWTVIADQPWLMAGPAIGAGYDTIGVAAVTENISLQPRSANVTVTAADSTELTVVVIQQGLIPEITVSQDTIMLAQPVSSGNGFSITANMSWTATADQSWLSLSPTVGSGSDTLTTIALTENPGIQTRFSTITITAADSTQLTVVVIQEGLIPEITVSQDTIILAQPASSSNGFSITANMSWTATADQSWLSLSPTAGSGSDTLATIALTENPGIQSRSSTISITAADSTQLTVVVIQEGLIPEITVSQDTIILAQPASSSDIFTISSTLAWTIETDQPWLSLSDSSGSGNDTITVTTLSENLSTQARTCNVTITAADSTVLTVFVIQEGVILSVNEATCTELLVYPNPADEYLHIELSEKSEEIVIELISISGQIIVKEYANEMRNALLDMSAITEGIYLLRIYKGSSVLHKKIVVYHDNN